MRAPHFDMEEMKKFKEENRRERLEFLDKYAEFVKKSKNKTWSEQQKNLID